MSKLRRRDLIKLGAGAGVSALGLLTASDQLLECTPQCNGNVCGDEGADPQDPESDQGVRRPALDDDERDQ